MRAAVVVLAVWLGGCALYVDPSAADDDGGDDDEPRDCDALYESWRAAANALDDSCVVDDECAVVNDGWPCECRPLGVAVNLDAYVGSEADRLEDELGFCEGELEGACDVGPLIPRCEDGRCVGYEDMICLLPPPYIGNECSPQPAFEGWESRCQETVCAEDQWCCLVAWDAACADRAALRCGVSCDTSVVVAGGGAFGRLGTDGSAEAPVPLPGDGAPTAIAWADDPTQQSYSAFAVGGPCAARIFGINSTPQVLVERFARAYSDCTADTAAFGGTRAIWVDLNHDDQLDVLFAGTNAVFWAQGSEAGWTDGGDVVPSGDGAFTDVAALDVDGDLEMDLVVTYAAAPAALFMEEPGPGFGFQRDAVWASASSGLTVAMACQLDADPARELILGGPATTEVFDVVDGVLTPLVTLDVGTTEIACGMISPVPAAAVAGADGIVRVLTADGVTWSSPRTFDVAAMEVRQTGVTWSLVIAETGPDTPLAVVVADAATGALVVETGIDPLPGVEATSLTLGDPY